MKKISSTLLKTLLEPRSSPELTFTVDEFNFRIGITLSADTKYVSEGDYNLFISALPLGETTKSEYIKLYENNVFETHETATRMITLLSNLWEKCPELGIQRIEHKSKGPQPRIHFECTEKVLISFENNQPVLKYYR